MTRKFLTAALACAATLAVAAPAQAARTGCDPIARGHCLLPFPNDFYTVRDGGSPTGRRLALPRAAMPRNKDGVRIDPREFNRADGFSPGQQITVRVPGRRHRRGRAAQPARADHRHRPQLRQAPARRADRRADGRAPADLDRGRQRRARARAGARC